MSLSLPSQASYISKMRLIFTRNIFLGVSFYDVTCNCDLTGSSLFSKHGIIEEVTEIQQKVKT